MTRMNRGRSELRNEVDESKKQMDKETRGLEDAVHDKLLVETTSNSLQMAGSSEACEDVGRHMDEALTESIEEGRKRDAELDTLHREGERRHQENTGSVDASREDKRRVTEAVDGTLVSAANNRMNMALKALEQEIQFRSTLMKEDDDARLTSLRTLEKLRHSLLGHGRR